MIITPDFFLNEEKHAKRNKTHAHAGTKQKSTKTVFLKIRVEGSSKAFFKAFLPLLCLYSGNREDHRKIHIKLLLLIRLGILNEFSTHDSSIMKEPNVGP